MATGRGTATGRSGRVPRPGGGIRAARRWLAAVWVVVAIALVGPLAAEGQGQAPRPAPRPLFGIAGHAWWSDEHFDEFLRMYRELGITGVRIPLDWKTFEPEEGRYDFSTFDRVFPRLDAAGVALDL